ncbi:MAG: bacterial Ig-like domain-containing protein, partial [Bacteroidales bacterium]|nr:bacterial Ig-like domain-containing protein [Bacteroidales bacterium]
MLVLPTLTARADGGEPALVDGYYQISTAEQLLWFANYVNSGNTTANAELINDIVLNENLLDKIEKGETENLVSWIPIGTYENSFRGSFKSNYHTISGLYINNPTLDCVGFFGCTWGRNNLMHISINDSYFAGHDYVGGIIGYRDGNGYADDWGYGHLSNSYFRGTVFGNNYVGGIAGYTETFMHSCYVVANVSGNSNVGAIIGSKGEKKMPPFRDFYYDNSLTTLKALGYTVADDAENNVIGKASASFHNGEIAYLFGFFNQDLSDLDSYPEFVGKYVHQNLDGNGYHNPEYVDGHCSHCIKYKYKIPEQDDNGVYQISTADELYGFMHLVNTGDNHINAVLTNDIVVNENVLEKVHSGNTDGLREWYSIGWQAYAGYILNNCQYAGVFDGNFHTISGLYFDSKIKEEGQVGLFANVLGTINNVIVKDAFFKGICTIGGITNNIGNDGFLTTNPVIENCIFDGEIVSERPCGGICCMALRATASCESYGSITIKNCINIGKIISESNYTGGILGTDWSNKTSVINCYNAGEIKTGDWLEVGGICGSGGVHTITNCYNTGKISHGFSIYCNNRLDGGNAINSYNNQDICNLHLVLNDNYIGNTTTATLCNGTLPEGFSSDDWIAGKTETADNGTTTYTFPHLKVFDGKYPAFSIEYKQPVSIKVETIPTKVEYNEGEKFDATGIKIVFVYADESTMAVDDITNFTFPCLITFTDFNNIKLGEQTITVKYKGEAIGEFTVTVKETTSEPAIVNGVYQITSASKLLWFANYVNSGNTNAQAELIDDIVLNENLLDKIDKGETENLVTWIPIGTEENQFKGSFNSNNHTISGLYINNSEQDYVGLFGYTSWNSISNCYVKDSYFAGRNYVGGICGRNTTVTSNSYFRGTITGNNYIGGIIGYPENTVQYCYVVGSISGSSNAGAIVGGINSENTNPSIYSCYYDKYCTTLKALGYTGQDDEENNVLGKSPDEFHSGEIAYLMGFRQDLSDPDSYPEYEGKYVHQNLNGNGYHNPEYENGHCKYCINYTVKALPQKVNGVYQISNAEELYGFMHLVNNGENNADAVLTADIVVNENVLEKVHSGNTAGLREWYSIGDNGYAGFVETNCEYGGVFDGNFHTISGLYYDSKLVGNSQCGLFSGVNNTVKNVIVKDTYFGNSATASGGIARYIQGAYGSNISPVIENCIFDGEINAQNAGGIVYSSTSLNGGTIKNCIHFGKITCSFDAIGTGGILGGCFSDNTSIINCYNTGEILCTHPLHDNTTSGIGGICGGGSFKAITNCYNTGKVSHGYSIIGAYWGSMEITNTYNNTDICDLPHIAYSSYLANDINTATLCNGTLPEGFSSDDWVAGKTETDDNGTITYTFPHLKVFDGKYPAYSITKPSVKSIAIKTPPSQTEYALGEDLNKDGLVVTFTYSDHTTIDVDYYGSYDQTSTEFQLNNSLMDSDFDNTSTGKKTVTITYNDDLTAEFDVTVVDKGKCGYQYLDEDGTLTFYYGNYRNGAGYIGESGCSKSFENEKVKKAVFDPSFIEFKPTNLNSMFGFYPNLQEIVDMDKYLNTEEVVNMAWMFGCCPLTTLDLSTFDTRKVKYMNGMFADFSGQTNFKTIYVGDKWSTENVEPCMMFLNCTNLVGEKGTKCNNEGRWDNTDLIYARVDGGEDAPGYFTYKAVVTPVDTVFTAPTKLSYIEGEELDLTGGKITIVFSDETTEDIDLTNADVTLSAFDNTAIGEQVITVKYKGVEIGTFTVTVAKPEPSEKEAYAVFDATTGTLT